jgi:Ca2+-binding RTX toxin-like protein
MAVYNGTSGNDRLIGTDAPDSLYGGSGNDFLNGRGGVDFMRGGNGNDIYLIFSEGENVREVAGAGTDTVLAGISYILEDNFENLELLGEATDNINGFGNNLNNKLIGNAGSNVLDGRGGNDSLDGGAGSDVLIGGAGNDRYRINSEADVAFEATAGTAGGTDTVVATVSYRAALGIENVNLRGEGNISAIGNAGANRIEGNGAANRIEGGGGNDVLAGGGGADRLLGGSGADQLVGGMGADMLAGGTGNDAFRYAAKDQFGDMISDFRDGDVFQFSAKALGAGLSAGQLAADRFVIRANDNSAQDANDRFVYNQGDDTLWFDSNGNGAGGTVLVADLDSRASVEASDIFLF